VRAGELDDGEQPKLLAGPWGWRVREPGPRGRLCPLTGMGRRLAQRAVGVRRARDPMLGPWRRAAPETSRSPLAAAGSDEDAPRAPRALPGGRRRRRAAAPRGRQRALARRARERAGRRAAAPARARRGAPLRARGARRARLRGGGAAA